MKKSVSNFGLLLLAAGAVHWGCEHQPALPELQRKCLLAKTEEAKAAVVAELQRYYYNLPVPKALRDGLDQQVAAQIDTTTINWVEDSADTNAYRMESRLQSLLTLAAIACAREETSTFQNLMGQAKLMAQAVDAGTQNDYWIPLVEEFRAYGKEQARAWLKVKRIASFCRAYQDSTEKFPQVESHAALGFTLLQQIHDERARLDLIQRLQYILFVTSRYDLSIALGQKFLPQAENLNYHLRTNGIIYTQAEAFFEKGENQQALRLYEAVLGNAERFEQIGGIAWFTKLGLLRIGDVYRKLGEFEKAWEVCQRVERLSLDQTEIILLQFLKFNLFCDTGRYEQAEAELEQARSRLESAKDVANLVTCLNNFGHLYSRLGEYDLARDHYKQAQALFTPSQPSLGTRLLIVTNLAYLDVIQGDSLGAATLMQEAQDYLELASSSITKSALLLQLGDWNKNARRFEAAANYFHRADSIFQQDGFEDRALRSRVEQAKCLIAYGQLQPARALLAGIESSLHEINDLERTIVARDLAAQISYREGNLAHALAASNTLLSEIDSLSASIGNRDYLRALRQTVYDCLKRAAQYEIALQRVDSAFSKLDNAKAYILKNRLSSGFAAHVHSGANGVAHGLGPVIKRLPKKSLLLDYMIMPDTLYVFAVDQSGIRLLRKPLAAEALKETVKAYLAAIVKTLDVIDHYDSAQAHAHYARTASLGGKLYQALLDWPELEACLQQAERLYLVPDEVLHELPFATLIVDHSETEMFVANRAAVVMLPSASLAASPLALATSFAEARVLFSVDRRFSSAEEFAAKVKKLFPQAEELALPDSAFTKAEVLARLKQDYQVYIFLGHGQANAQYPERGFIELSVKSPQRAQAKISRLTMADLKTIDWLGAEMVMLVGCETARGKLYRGSGISGLQQEFLALGVRNVCGNLWEVEATSAIAHAQDFLAAWAAHGNPALALQETQRKAIQALRHNRYYQAPHPYFWGSATLLTTTLH